MPLHLKTPDGALNAEAVVLDMDNTLYRVPKEKIAKIWWPMRRLLIAYLLRVNDQLPVTRQVFLEKINEFAEKAEVDGWSTTFVEQGGDPVFFKEALKFVEVAHYLDYDVALVAFLKELMEWVPVYIFTGASREQALGVLEVLLGDLAEKLKEEDRILTVSDLGGDVSKPQAAAYQQMIDYFNLNPETTIYVDDHIKEVRTALIFGFLTFLLGENEQVEIGDLAGLIAVLKSVFALREYLEFE